MYDEEFPFIPDYKAPNSSNLFKYLQNDIDKINIKGLKKYSKFVVFLVDGFGWKQYNDLEEEQIPTLYNSKSTPIHSCLPTSTPTVLASIVNSLTPIQHGVFGVRVPAPQSIDSFENNSLLNILAWHIETKTSNNDLSFNKSATPDYKNYMQNQSLSQNSNINYLTRRHFLFGEFTKVHLLKNYFGWATRGQMISKAKELLKDKPYLFLYDDVIDLVSHSCGVNSKEYLYDVKKLDDFIKDLRSELDDDTALLVTADHGIINVGERISCKPLEALNVIVSGESRFRLVTWPQNATDYEIDLALSIAWEIVGDTGIVVKISDAIADGWFGPIDGDSGETIKIESLDRLKNSLVMIPRGDKIYVNEAYEHEKIVKSMHGSATKTEVEVPLILVEKNG
jgi:hypothetical protein